MSDLQVFPVSLPGGINQSAPAPSEQDLEDVENFGIYRNRLGLRPPIRKVADILDDSATPQPVSAILDIISHQGRMLVASWSSNTDKVYLHSLQVDGSQLTLEAVVWDGVIAKPTVKLVSFAGGTADMGISRVYVSDYDQNLPTRVWDGSSVADLTVDLDADGVAESVYFSLMFVHKFHLWGTGFYEGTALRPEMVRFSQPGCIPMTDDAGGLNPREWHSADHLSLGRRGDKIVAGASVGDRLVLFQRRAIHCIYGTGADTWSRQEISTVIGAVGPHAVAVADKRIAYFYAGDGPYRTDGVSIEYIGEPIRDLVARSDADEREVRVGYSPDDGLVHFVVSRAGHNHYGLDLVFDTRQERWLRSTWGNLQFGALASLDSAAPPGPAGAPSGVSALTHSSSSILVGWSNGDVNVDTVTHVYRSTTDGFTPNDATNRVGVVSTGGLQFLDFGLLPATFYYYKVRHFRNSQHSSESAQVSASTKLAEPTGLGVIGLTSGVRVVGNNNAVAQGASIVLQYSLNGVDFTDLANLGTGPTFSYDHTGLASGLSIWYSAKAVAAGYPDSDWTTVVGTSGLPTSIPNSPTDLTAVPASTTRIDLSWVDQSNNEDSFSVFASQDNGANYSLIAVVFPNTTTYSATGLASNTTYRFFVVASNAVGSSGPSNIATATTFAHLDPPLNLSAVSTGVSTIRLTWTDTANDESGWEIHQSNVGAGGPFGVVAVAGAGSESHTVTGLSANTQYWFKVRAIRGNQVGGMSNVATASSTGSPPNAPSNLTAVRDTLYPSSRINLSWTDNSSQEQGFEIQRRAESSPFYTVIVTPPNTISYQDVDLSPGTSYTYRVRATHSVSGNSAWSNEADETTSGSSGVPPEPVGFTAQPDNSDLDGIEVRAVDLSWMRGGTNEEYFVLERCSGPSCSDWTTLVVLPANIQSYRDTSVVDHPTDYTIYRYRLKATNSLGDSGYVGPLAVQVEPQVAPSNVQVVDNPYCEGGYIPRARLSVSWSSGDTTGLVTRRLQRLLFTIGSGTWVTIAEWSSSPESVNSYDDITVTPGGYYMYRVVDDYGTVGENTGVFVSTPSQSVRASYPVDCQES